MIRLRRHLVTEIVSRCIEKSKEENLYIAVFKYLLVPELLSIDMLANLFVTARKRSWGKVMFSEACVSQSVHRKGG